MVGIVFEVVPKTQLTKPNSRFLPKPKIKIIEKRKWVLFIDISINLFRTFHSYNINVKNKNDDSNID